MEKLRMIVSYLFFIIYLNKNINMASMMDLIR